MPLPYSEKVIEHFKNPKNVGEMKDYDAKASEGSPACGDMVTVYLKVDREKKITDISFESYGCASNIATGSIITEMAKGKTLDEAKKLNWRSAMDELGGLPSVKVHCSVLAVDVLKSAIKNYEEKYGLVKPEEKTPTDVEKIKERLRKVMNPVVGMNIIATKVVKDIQVKDGVVTVALDLSKEHQFAPAIEEDIRERTENIWDVKKVRVIFREK